MKDADISGVLARMRRVLRASGHPYVSRLARGTRDPFRTLVSCIISLRTKDEVTGKAAERLFRLASSPKAMAKLDAGTIERAIYPAGFYRTKARRIRSISRRIEREYAGRVPSTIGELLEFEGVGRKTANLVVSMGYGKPAVCVDTHVHRIMNRLGYVRTRTAARTEQALREKLPRRHWREANPLLVAFGQTICTPVSPFCSRCPVGEYCERRGVKRQR